MAQKKLVQLPEMGIPSTGDVTYLVSELQSFQTKLDRIAATIVTQYGLVSTNLPTNFMSVNNAEIVLQGLNNAAAAKLDPSRININLDDFISGYFDVDGGTFYDTFSNSSTFDGGTL